MRDVELYRAILGPTPPWTVVRVQLDVKGEQVVVQVDAVRGRLRARSAGHAERVLSVSKDGRDDSEVGPRRSASGRDAGRSGAHRVREDALGRLRTSSS